jgi:uracil-DNA glycosylase
MDSRIILVDTLNSLRTTLEQMARWGCAGFECADEALAVVDRWAHWKSAQTAMALSSQKAAAGSALLDEQVRGPETLEQIRADLGDCRRCALASGRARIVFGEGHPRARLAFVGEGPGFEEDRSGRPFVGPAGQMLTRIIDAMKLTRDQVYICNVVKCRPPDNRDPLAQEIASCRPFLERQLAAINPEVICTLGTHATQTLLDTTMPVSRLRGRFHTFKTIKVMPTYHPAYLLRNPDRKRHVWEDMKKIMALLRIPL